MRIIVPRSPAAYMLRFLRHTLLAGGLFALGYCALVVIDSWAFQDQESQDFDRQLLAQRQASTQKAKLPLANLSTKGLVGRIQIPRLGVEAIVMEGTSKTTLRRAVGHIAGTALPGQLGNVGISGHRDTFFRPLRNIRQNDIITLTTLSGEFRYRVVTTKIVTPFEVAVLDSTQEEILTLVTCYPFYFLGSAPDRFIVRAERVS